MVDDAPAPDDIETPSDPPSPANPKVGNSHRRKWGILAVLDIVGVGTHHKLHKVPKRQQPRAISGYPCDHQLRNSGFRRDLFVRRAVYGLLLGDRGTPGVIRGLASVVWREHDVMRAVVPSLRGQLDALWRIRGGRPVQMLGCETRPLSDS